MFNNDLYIGGLNCVTESAHYDSEESLEETRTVKQNLKNIQVKEVLLRRFVASQELESGAAEQGCKRGAKDALKAFL